MDDGGHAAGFLVLDLFAGERVHAGRGGAGRLDHERRGDGQIGGLFHVGRDQAFPAAQLGPPQITAVALPSLSSVTGKLGPVAGLERIRKRPAEVVLTAAVELLGAEAERVLGVHRFALHFDDVGDARGAAELALVHERGQGVDHTPRGAARSALGGGASEGRERAVTLDQLQGRSRATGGAQRQHEPRDHGKGNRRDRGAQDESPTPRGRLFQAAATTGSRLSIFIHESTPLQVFCAPPPAERAERMFILLSKSYQAGQAAAPSRKRRIVSGLGAFRSFERGYLRLGPRGRPRSRRGVAG